MTGRMILALCLALMAAPLWAQSAEKGAALMAALRQNGCKLTEAQTGPLLAADFSTEEIKSIAGTLIDAGLAYVDRGSATLILSEKLCAAAPDGDAALFATVMPATTDLSLERVESYGRSGVRGEVALYLYASGCAIDLTDRDKAVADLTTMVITNGKFSPDMSEAARGKLTALVADFVADPGKAYDIGADRLTLKHCTP